jgi:hypothetical protein
MSVEKVMNDARIYMRDPARFFVSTVARTGLTLTFDSGHPNLMQGGLMVQAVRASDGATAIGVNDINGSVTADGTHFGYIIDEREGLVRVTKPITGSPGFNADWAFTIEGYYYEWIADADLRMFANNIIAEHDWHREDWDPDDPSDVESDAMALGTAAEAMMSLYMEYARDVDINTPEGVSIPASSRFHQVQALLFGPGGLASKYSDKAQMLGVGLDRIEVLTLTRTSRTTNRLVPRYRPREWDDARIPQRIFAPIGVEGPTSPPPDFIPFPIGFYDQSPNP